MLYMMLTSKKDSFFLLILFLFFFLREKDNMQVGFELRSRISIIKFFITYAKNNQ